MRGFENQQDEILNLFMSALNNDYFSKISDKHKVIKSLIILISNSPCHSRHLSKHVIYIEMNPELPKIFLMLSKSLFKLKVSEQNQ